MSGSSGPAYFFDSPNDRSLVVQRTGKKVKEAIRIGDEDGWILFLNISEIVLVLRLRAYRICRILPHR